MPGGACLEQRIPQPGGGARILRADEHDAGGRTDGEAGQGEALEHAVRVLFHEQAVRIGTGVALITVGHHDPRRRVLQRGPPFGGGAEPGSAPPPQLCGLDQAQDVLGCC